MRDFASRIPKTLPPTLLLLLIAAVVLAAGCTSSTMQTVEGGAASGPPPEPPALVRVETIRKDTISPKFLAMGNLRAIHTSIVASGSDGIVESFADGIKVGAFVREGTLLTQLRMKSTDLDIAGQEAVLSERRAELEEILTPRKEDLDEAKARLRATEIAWDNARRQLGEITALNQRGAANLTEVKDAQDNVDGAEQNYLASSAALERLSIPRTETVERARARVEAQEQHVAFLKSEREKRTTMAPFDGFVVEEHTYKGQWLSKGSPVLTLAKLDEVEVEVQIDQQYVDQIRPGLNVDLSIRGTRVRGISAPELTGSGDGPSEDAEGLSMKTDAPLEVWKGTVAAVVPRSKWKEGSRSFPVIIRIKNRFDRTTDPMTPALREGMMAEAVFNGNDVVAIVVPKDSIVRTSKGNFIYVINPAVEGKPLSVRQVLVTPGLSSGTWIQVNGENLEDGMQVVTEGAERLRASQSVLIQEIAGESKADKDNISETQQ